MDFRPSLGHPDPENSPDAQVVALLQRLQELPAAPRPRAEFRSELRAQLVAIAPRFVAQSPELPATTRQQGAARPKVTARKRSLRVRLITGVVVAACLVLALVGGVGMLAQRALPGDTLYGAKRATEGLRLSLTRDEQSRGDLYLQFASRRTAEISSLLNQSRTNGMGAGLGGQLHLSAASATVDAKTQNLILSTFNAHDANARSGVQTLVKVALAQRSPAALAALQQWVSKDGSQLNQIAEQLPAGPLTDRAKASVNLVAQVAKRTQVAAAAAGCSCPASSGGSDALGPLPCTNAQQCPSGAAAAASPSPSASPTASPTASPSASPQPSASPAPATPGATRTPVAATPEPAPSPRTPSPATPEPATPAPTQPPPAPSATAAPQPNDAPNTTPTPAPSPIPGVSITFSTDKTSYATGSTARFTITISNTGTGALIGVAQLALPEGFEPTGAECTRSWETATCRTLNPKSPTLSPLLVLSNTSMTYTVIGTVTEAGDLSASVSLSGIGSACNGICPTISATTGPVQGTAS